MQPKLSKTKILLIDDNDIDAKSIRRLVTRHSLGLPIVRACNGVEALEILNAPAEKGLYLPYLPYIILLDINMPLMNGFELLDHLLENGPAVEVPIYILSTSDSIIDRRKMSKYPISGYLVKPLTIESLVGILC